MLLTSLVTAAAEAPHLEISPAVVGGGSLLILLIMLAGLLMFGRGREHS